MTITSRALSPSPRWTTERIEAPCMPSSSATWASTPETTASLAVVGDVESAFYLAMEVDDRPGVLAQVAEILGLQGVSIKSVVQKGLGEDAVLVMVMHPVLESRFSAAVELLARLDFVRARPRTLRVIEETFEEKSA